MALLPAAVTLLAIELIPDEAVVALVAAAVALLAPAVALLAAFVADVAASAALVVAVDA